MGHFSHGTSRPLKDGSRIGTQKGTLVNGKTKTCGPIPDGFMTHTHIGDQSSISVRREVRISWYQPSFRSILLWSGNPPQKKGEKGHLAGDGPSSFSGPSFEHGSLAPHVGHTSSLVVFQPKVIPGKGPLDQPPHSSATLVRL